jgi:hypothetical protein
MEFDLQNIKCFLFLLMSPKHVDRVLNLVIRSAVAELLRLNIAAFSHQFGCIMLHCVATVMSVIVALVETNHRIHGTKIFIIL